MLCRWRFKLPFGDESIPVLSKHFLLIRHQSSVYMQMWVSCFLKGKSAGLRLAAAVCSCRIQILLMLMLLWNARKTLKGLEGPQRYRLQRWQSKTEVGTRVAIRGIKTLFRFFQSWESYGLPSCNVGSSVLLLL